MFFKIESWNVSICLKKKTLNLTKFHLNWTIDRKKWNEKSLNELNQLKFCEVSHYFFSNRCWKSWKKLYFVNKIVLTDCVKKIVLVIEKNFWNSRLKGENFQNFWHNLNNLFKQWKVRTIFGNRLLFKLVPGCFSDLIQYENWNSNFEK